MPVGRGDLIAEEQEILSHQAQVMADPLFQPSLQIELRGGEPDRPVSLNAPQLHLNGHVACSSLGAALPTPSPCRFFNNTTPNCPFGRWRQALGSPGGIDLCRVWHIYCLRWERGTNRSCGCMARSRPHPCRCTPVWKLVIS